MCCLLAWDRRRCCYRRRPWRRWREPRYPRGPLLRVTVSASTLSFLAETSSAPCAGGSIRAFRGGGPTESARTSTPRSDRPSPHKLGRVGTGTNDRGPRHGNRDQTVIIASPKCRRAL